ncbi:uncharacterized protein LOC132186593 [Corylus avellana]|uniref:uncharacterized protein LOC132186593 n=1 Tax=Corylus avellana TaxID=13451 RepID=UPI00286CDDE8|nr:uncharacterized protein LOC132186593 [Corylus avellana]
MDQDIDVSFATLISMRNACSPPSKLTMSSLRNPPSNSTSNYQRNSLCMINCPRNCDACGKAINGFVYHCKAKDLNLHPCCRNLKKKINIGCVKFWLRQKVSKSIWCKENKLKDSVEGIPSWSYESKRKNYHCQLYCVMDMVLESWKNRPKDNNNCLALENLELPLQPNSRSSGKGSKYLQIVKMFLSTILTILLGDPTIAFASLLAELVTK